MCVCVYIWYCIRQIRMTLHNSKLYSIVLAVNYFFNKVACLFKYHIRK